MEAFKYRLIKELKETDTSGKDQIMKISFKT